MLVAAALTLTAPKARGDGGAVQASSVAGPYRVTVLTEPTPVRVGPIDVSVLVQDNRTRKLAGAARVSVRGAPVGTRRWRPATPHAGQSRLYHGAVLDLDRPGQWTLVIRIAGRQGPARLSFDMNVAPAPPPWIDLWAWLAWPLVPIFGMGVRLLRRIREEPRPRAKLRPHSVGTASARASPHD